MIADAHRTPASRQRRIRGNAWLQAASVIVLLAALGIDSGGVRASHAGAGSATSVPPLSLLRLGNPSGDAIQPPVLSEPGSPVSWRSAGSTVEPLADGSTGLAGAASAAAVSVPDGPSIMALEAAEHARDRLNFAPGGAVTVPFEPESGDRWPVDGRTPRSLPAGSATGIEMAASRQGSVWAVGSAPGGSAGAGSGNEPASEPTPDGPSGDVGAVSALPASARVSGDAPLLPPGATGLRRQVFGFLPYWKVNSSTTVLNDDLLSTIAYFGVGVDSAGNLLKRNSDGSTTVGWSGWTSSKLTSIINAAHTKHTRRCRLDRLDLERA